MVSLELDDLRAYAAALRTYSNDEVEDVYFHIDILKYPVRYELVRLEMLRRRLSLSEEPKLAVPSDLGAWLAGRRCLASRPRLRTVVLAGALTALAAAVTAAMLAPVWLFAVAWSFRGVQSAIVYMAYAPIPPLAGIAASRRVGARGWYAAAAVAGTAVSVGLFAAVSGVPRLMIHDMLTTSGAGGGFSFGP